MLVTTIGRLNVLEAFKSCEVPLEAPMKRMCGGGGKEGWIVLATY